MKRKNIFITCLLIGLVSFSSYIKDIDNGVNSFYKSYRLYFPIGTAISPEADLSSIEKMNFIVQNYNSVTPENQMKIRSIHPKEKVYNWKGADQIVAFARKNKMKIRGHTLIWQQNVPEWLVMNGDKFADKELLLNRMKEHIEAVVQRYKNDVYCWDVVNEAISDKSGEIFRAKDSLYQIAGEEYIDKAFIYARKSNPNAKLFYNDYRFSNPEKRNKIFELLKRLKEKGIPIDGVGMQSHYTPNEVTEQYLQETIDMFSSLGLEIQVTELDVSVYNYRDKGSQDLRKEDDILTPEREKKQADFYEMLFKVYRRNKGKITGVTFWGSADARKNYRTNKIGKMDYPFMFDEFLQPKKIFYSITNFNKN